jgi:hypothetical protein
MREGTTSRVMAADRPNGEFYDFYSVSSEYFGYTIVEQSHNSQHTSQQVHCLCVTNTVRLMLFENITAIYCKNRAININNYTVREKAELLKLNQAL